MDSILAHETLLWWLAGTSLLTFIATLILVPFFLVRLPADYFAHDKRLHVPWAANHPVLRPALLFIKNCVGLLFLLAGILMLFLPGQGLLTMVMGVVLLDIPGKYRLESWLISHRPILRSINWLRRRAGRPQLILDAKKTTS
ncbi:MAG: hypothetical protein C0613_10550 [Desulfobulbaceae bacterium]|nr:MAG: hypothetical protein C0613_10550 [Desulfobulbaceae bacterium]